MRKPPTDTPLGVAKEGLDGEQVAMPNRVDFPQACESNARK